MIRFTGNPVKWKFDYQNNRASSTLNFNLTAKLSKSKFVFHYITRSMEFLAIISADQWIILQETCKIQILLTRILEAHKTPSKILAKIMHYLVRSCQTSWNILTILQEILCFSTRVANSFYCIIVSMSLTIFIGTRTSNWRKGSSLMLNIIIIKKFVWIRTKDVSEFFR